MTSRHLLNNHICFLKQNRGLKRYDNENIIISSEVDHFDITFSINDQQSDFTSKLIYSPEWSSHAKHLVNSDNIEKIADLIYMSATPKILKDWKTNNSIVTKKVVTDSDLETFSIVQARGFCDTQETYNEWFPFLRKKNFEGTHFQNQHFFIAYMADKAVGTCLIIDSDSLYGIYAVATLPDYRKKGIATSAMKSALEQCVSLKTQNLTLQTIKHSNATKLYQQLGFEKAFYCEILKNKDAAQDRI